MEMEGHGPQLDMSQGCRYGNEQFKPGLNWIELNWIVGNTDREEILSFELFHVSDVLLGRQVGLRTGMVRERSLSCVPDSDLHKPEIYQAI